MSRSITNLPRVKIDTENGADELIEFLLDTGASGSLIRKDAVEKLGAASINRTERVKYIGVANNPRISMGTVSKTFWIAERAFYVKFDVVKDLPVEGILGADFINQYVVFINNQTGILTSQQEPIKFHEDFALNRCENDFSRYMHFSQRGQERKRSEQTNLYGRNEYAHHCRNTDLLIKIY